MKPQPRYLKEVEVFRYFIESASLVMGKLQEKLQQQEFRERLAVLLQAIHREGFAALSNQETAEEWRRVALDLGGSGSLTMLFGFMGIAEKHVEYGESMPVTRDILSLVVGAIRPQQPEN